MSAQIITLTPDLLFEAALEPNAQYPIAFDYAWRWLGYKRKEEAVRLLRANYQEGPDFSAVKRNQTRLIPPQSGTKDLSAAKRKNSRGRPTTEYRLTLRCFKMLAMMAETEQGRQVRLYFVEAEERLHAMLRADREAQMAELHVRRQLAQNERRLKEERRQFERRVSPLKHAIRTQREELAELQRRRPEQLLLTFDPAVFDRPAGLQVGWNLSA